MKILFVNAYFMPETIAFSHLERDLLEGLVAAGHEIQVLCPTPTRAVTPQQRAQYRGRKHEQLYGASVQVRRFWAPQEGKNPILRAFRYLWCNLRQYQLGRRCKGIDAVFAVSTPPTQGLLAGQLARKLGCPFVYSLQDVFPDSLVTTGLTHEGSLLYKLGAWVERRTYAYAQRIIVISEACRRNLLSKGVAGHKLSLISNWVDIEEIRPIARQDNTLISEFHIDPDKFLVVYAGNFGAAQGADIILEAAQKLLDRQSIHFVIFGGGAEYEAAVRRVAEQGLTNVTINPLLPQERVSEVYSLGDVALITCKPGVGNSGMPSKTWSIMACNTPIIASFDSKSDLADAIKAAGTGSCVPAGDVDALTKALMEAFRQWKSGSTSPIQPRDYVRRHAEKNTCLKKYIQLLEASIAKWGR